MNKHKHKFSLVSLGCARSLVDSESMVDGLHKVGFELVPEGTQERITVLNTCSFIESAILETEKNITALINDKQKGKINHLVVAGCYPSRFKESRLKEKYPDVDLWFTTKQEHALPEQLATLVFKKKFTPKKKRPYTKLSPSHYAYLKISEGCNNWCSFCTIPKIRGVHVSRPLDALIKEASFQLSLGVKELILIAEDTTCWGEDIYGKPSLPILLEALAKLPIPWIRLMYIFPSRVDDALIKVIQNYDNILPYIDMPIQHVNTRLLASMRRRHDKAFLENLIKRFQEQIPNLALRSTFILGFPGEEASDVVELCDFLTDFPFDQVGCFTYSQELGTLSYKLDNQVSSSLAKKRVDQVMATQYTLLQTLHKKRIGKTYTAIYEGNRTARAYFQAPEVDTVIILNENPPLSPGTFFTVKITGLDAYDLLGTPC